MRWLPALVLGAFLTALHLGGEQQPAASLQTPLTFPSVSAYALNKARVSLPADFAGQSNLLLLSFEREQQKDVDTWLPLAKDLQKADPNLRVYMLPVFTHENMLYRWWQNSSLRSSTSDPEWIEFTVPLYLDKPRFRRDLNILTERDIIVLLVDKSGKVLWRSEGPLTDEKKSTVTSLLTPTASH